MATISNTPRPGYVWDSTDNVWYPIGVGGHSHPDYITQATAISPTTVDAKGDLLVGSAADTISRLAVGADGSSIVADSSTATGLKWATPASGGGMTLLSTTTLSGTSTTISSINQTYTNLFVYVYGVSLSAANQVTLKLNNGNTSVAQSIQSALAGYLVAGANTAGALTYEFADGNYSMLASNTNNAWQMTIGDYTNTAGFKPLTFSGFYTADTTDLLIIDGGGAYRNASAVTSIVMAANGSTFNAGTVKIWGVK